MDGRGTAMHKLVHIAFGGLNNHQGYRPQSADDKDCIFLTLERKSEGWLKYLFGGIGVAVFVFAADKVWDIVSVKKLKPEYVIAAAEREGDQVILTVKNESDEQLDLTKAIVVFAGFDPPHMDLGVYVEPTLYEIDWAGDSMPVEWVDDKMLATITLKQTIKAGESDRLSFSVENQSERVSLAGVEVSAELFDLKGNAYRLKVD